MCLQLAAASYIYIYYALDKKDRTVVTCDVARAGLLRPSVYHPFDALHHARLVKYAQFLVASFVLIFGLNVYMCSGMSLTLMRPLKVDSFQQGQLQLDV